MTEWELAARLEAELKQPQRSERWAMYRLIVPVVDLANETLGLRAYFEYNQTSAHGSSQSVDLALLDGDEPRVMVEAKSAGRAVGAELIAKYLTAGARGVVTNGVHWVLCEDGRSEVVSIWDAEKGRVPAAAVERVLAFLRGGKQPEGMVGNGAVYAAPVVRPQRPAKEQRARRVSNGVTRVSDVEELRRETAALERATELESLLLRSLAEAFEKMGGVPSHLRGETRSSRVSYFDERIGEGSKRVFRVELGHQQPDVLVLTRLAGPGSELAGVAPSTPHVKGPHMRRFRLSSEAQTREFGRLLAEALAR